jgi:hypothetical protein
LQSELFGNEPAPATPKKPKKTTNLSPEEVQALGDAAALIRKHLWLGPDPPPPPHPNDRPWHLGRDLNIWKLIHKKTPHSPDAINGAIEHARGVLSHQNGTPLSMRIFWHAESGTPILEQAVGAYHKAQPASTFGPGQSVSLPPKIRDILRDMLDGS